DVVEGLGGKARQRLRRHLHHALPLEGGVAHIVGAELAVGGPVLAEREKLLIDEIRHGTLAALDPCRRPGGANITSCGRRRGLPLGPACRRLPPPALRVPWARARPPALRP